MIIIIHLISDMYLYTSNIRSVSEFKNLQFSRRKYICDITIVLTKVQHN